METRLALTLAVSLLACRPEIGDACETSTDCSPTGDRLCDITQPGGYCTVFNCEPDSCPEEASCVKFGDARSSLPGCEDPLGAGPYARTFCMKRCEDDSDCRGGEGYRCLDPWRTWHAVVLEGFSKVCGTPIPDDRERPVLTEGSRENEVCTGGTPMPDGAGGAGDGAAGAGG